MALELKQQVRLSQQLVMTPQLQQAIKLLQLSRMELVDLVHQELQENPVLEEGVEADEELAAAAGAAPEERDAVEATAEVMTPDATTTATVEAGDEPSYAEKIADLDWQDYMDANPHTGMREVASPDDRPSIDATYTRRETLAEHLTWQLQLASLPVEQEVAARFIIGNLDDRGYLRSPLEEISRQCGIREEVIGAALAVVQEFDPSGVAARDLRECLTIQTRALAIDDPLVLRILDEQLDALIKRDFRGVARALGASIEDVAAASPGDRPAGAAARPRLRRRGPDLHRPGHLRAPPRRRVPRRAQRRRPAAVAHQLAVPRSAREGQPRAEGHQGVRERQGPLGAMADQVDPPAPAHDLQGDAEHHQATSANSSSAASTT